MRAERFNLPSLLRPCERGHGTGEIIEPLRDRIVGRVALERIADPFSGGALVEINNPGDGTEPREYALPSQGAGTLGTPRLPRGVHVNMHEGERVRRPSSRWTANGGACRRRR
jgi:hypothetical protein